MFVRAAIVVLTLFASVPFASMAGAEPLAVWPSPQAVVFDEEGLARLDLVVVHTGLEPAEEVSVRDVLAPGAELVASEPPAVAVGDALVWHLGELLPGESRRVRLTLRGGLDQGAVATAVVGATERVVHAAPAAEAPADPELRAALRPTPDADAADPEVLALVARHQGDLAALRAFVRSQVRYEVYLGSLRGARGTLWSRGGNALDQASLLVAAARAAGVPARYAYAELAEAEARALLAELFPPLENVLTDTPEDPDTIIAQLLDADWRLENMGAELAGQFAALGHDAASLRAVLYPDATQDAALLAEARAHAWAQLYLEGAWVDVDPTRDAAPPAAEATGLEVEEARRHHVELAVRAEHLNPTFGGALRDQTDELLRVRLPSAELAGRPLTVRFEQRTVNQGGLVFSTIIHTYTPVLEVGDVPRASGAAAQELLTNFPAATTILTGLFVDATVSGPGGAGAETYPHVSFDRLGYAARNVGQDDVTVNLPPIGEDPAISRFHRTLVHVGTSAVPDRMGLGSAMRTARLRAAGMADVVEPLRAFVAEHGEDALLPAAMADLYPAAQRLIAELNASRVRSAGFKYFTASGRLLEVLAAHHLVTAYSDTPRLLFAEARDGAESAGMVLSTARSGVRALSRPELPGSAADVFRFTYGVMDKSIEGGVAESLRPEGARLITWDVVAQAAEAQSIAMRFATNADRADLLALDLPRDALGRMQQALGKGHMLIYPEAPVLVDGEPTYLWLTYDPKTGAATTMSPHGHRPAAIEYGIKAAKAVWKAGGPSIVANAIAGAAFGGVIAAFDAIANKNGWNARGFGWGALGLCIGPWAPNPGNIVAVLADGIKQAIAEGFRAFTAGAGVYVAVRIARCISFMAAYGVVRGTMEYIFSKTDPPISAVEAQGIIAERPIGPPNAHRDTVALGAGLAVADPPAAPDRLRVEGDYTLTGGGRFVAPSAALEVSGRLVRDGQDLGARSLRLTATGVWFEGDAQLAAAGTLRVEPDGATGEAAGVLAFAGGALGFTGTVDGVQGDWRLEEATGVVRGRGAWGLPRGLVVRVDDAALLTGAEAFDGVTGEVVVGAEVAVAATATARLAAGADTEGVEIGRGEDFTFEVLAETSAAGDHLIEAEGPADWQVQVEGAVVTVRPAAETPHGEYHVHYWVRDVAQERRVAGGAVRVRLGAAPAPVAVSLAYEPLLTVHAGGRHLPLAFIATIDNAGEAQRTFQLVSAVPAEATGRLGQATVTLPPGGRARVGLTIQSVDPLPAPGTPFTVSVTALDGDASASGVLTIPFPEVWGADAVLEPPYQYAAPGQTVDLTLRVTPWGNTEGTLLTEAPHATRNAALDGLPAEIPVVPGEAQAVPLTLTVGPDTPIGLNYVANLRFARQSTGARVAEAIAVVVARSAENLGVIELARAARDAAGRDDLYADLLGFAQVLQDLARGCDPDKLEQLRRLMVTAVADLTDEVYREVAADLQAQADALFADRDCEVFSADDVVAALAPLGDLFEALRDHDFDLRLGRVGALVQPGQAAPFTLRIERRGALPTTIDLQVEDLDGEVESPVAPDPLIEAHPLTVTPAGPGRHRFRVVATVVGAPQIRRVVHGVVVARPEWVQVPRVGSDPPFAVPGAELRPFADLFNTAGAPQDLLVDTTVRRPDDSVVFASETPVAFRLAALDGLQRVTLPRVSLYGESAGHYVVEVGLRRAADGEPVPGGFGQGVVFVGQPFDADLTVEPPLLPPGDVDAQVTIAARRRPGEAFPGLGVITQIEQYVGNASGPAGVAVGPDGSIYFANFGTERNSNVPGFQAGNTIGRVDPQGFVEEFAVVPQSPTRLTFGPDGALYASNVGRPERISRISIPDGEVTPWFDFTNTAITGGGRGENVLGITFDPAGETLYAAELYDSVLFGLVTWGKRIYRIRTDENGQRVADNLIAQGLDGPTEVIVDPRTGDVLVIDSRQDRIVRINTEGPAVITPLVSGYQTNAGLVLTDEGVLIAIGGDSGEIWAWQTAAEDGHTVVVSEGRRIGAGLSSPISLMQDLDGRLITTAFELDSVVRVHLEDVVPALVELDVAHAALDADEASALPDLGAGGPRWDDDGVRWTHAWAAEVAQADFSVVHPLQGLAPGQVVQLSAGTTLTYRHNDVEATATLPPKLVVVDHLLGLSPDTRAVRTGDPAVYTVRLVNHTAADDVYALAVEGLPNGTTAVFPAETAVPAGQTVTVQLQLTPGDDVPVAGHDFTVTVTTAGGRTDSAVGRLEITRRGVLVSVDPPHQEVRWGEEGVWQVTFTRRDGDTCRAGQLRSSGLARIAADNREASGLVDYYRQGNVLTVTVRKRLTGPGGAHAVRFWLEELIDCGGALDATATVTITDPQTIAVWADPDPQLGWEVTPFTLHAFIRNDTLETRRVRLERCCGPVYWSPTFDAGPHTLAPGETRAVPIHMRPNGILRGEYTHRLTATDVDRAEIRGEHIAVVNLRPRPVRMTLLNPTAVTAADGVARFTMRFERDNNVPARPMTYVVDGPLAFDADPQTGEVPLAATRQDLPVTLRGLTGLAPGPWPVRFRAWPSDDPEAVFEVFGSVTIPAGGLRAGFQPEAVHTARPEQVFAALVVGNDDFARARDFQVAYAAEPPLAIRRLDEEATALAGAEAVTRVALTPPRGGRYTVTATVTPAEGEPIATTLELVALDPALAPRIDGYEVDPPPVEGSPFVLRLQVSDPDDALDTLRFDFDRDGDGIYDEPDGLVGLWNLGPYADDGTVSVAVRVRDPLGNTTEQVLEVVVANVPPIFVTEPPLEGSDGVEYRYAPATVDPGADVVTLRLEGPEGATLEDGEVRWTPTLAQAVAGEAELLLVADDGDGGLAEQRWTVALTIRDDDGDQVPDACAEQYGPFGGPDEDDDGDGLSNRDECLDGRSPIADGRPPAPTLRAPADGRAGVAAEPSLEVEPVVDPDGDAVTYAYELRVHDPALAYDEQPLVAEAAGVDDTRWTPPDALPEGLYAWRARAADRFAPGPWSAVWTFRVGSGEVLIDQVVLAAPREEGRAFAAHVLANGPAGLRYAVDTDGDGAFEQENDTGDFTLTFPDDGAYPVTFAAWVAGGERAERVVEVDVANVAPVLVGTPAERADEGEPYVYAPAVEDPGADDVVLALDGPPGAALIDGAVRWTPDFAAAQAREHHFVLTADDGDGGVAEQRWTVTVRFRDLDGDGLPDDCAARYGLDGDGDADGDGRSNLEECLRGSSPVDSGVPLAPRLIEPEDGAEGVEARPTFVIEAAPDPDGDPNTFTFEITAADDAAFDDRPMLAGVTDHADTSWQPEQPLADGLYEWRARAADDAVAGPWSEVHAFQVGIIEPDAGPDATVADATAADAASADAGGDAEAADADPDAATPDARVDDGALPDAAPILDASPDPPERDFGGIRGEFGVGEGDVGAGEGSPTAHGGVDDGCDCDAGGRSGPVPLLLLLAMALGLRRRRR